MNSLLNLFGGAAGNGTSILFQAIGAAMRGESPQDFIQKLANSDPRLKKVDLNDLMGSAQQLANEKGLNIEDVQKQIDQAINPMINK